MIQRISSVKKLRTQPNPLGFKAKAKPKLEQWRNMMENEAPMPTSLIARNLLPPWLSFYEHKVGFNPKTHSMLKKTIMKLRRQKWSEEKIATFN